MSRVRAPSPIPPLPLEDLPAAVAFAVDALFRYGLGVDFPAPEIHARIDVP